MPQLAKIKF